MKIIGITGSFGKTSVAYLLHMYLNKLNISNRLYSSLDYEVAIDSNEALLKAIKESKTIEYLILEINEEYIDKIDKQLFDIKVLTNLSVITKKNEFTEYKNKVLSFFDNTSHNILCYSPEIGREEYIEFINKLDNKTLFGSFYELTKYEINKDEFYSMIYNDNKPIDNINGIKFYIKRHKQKDLLVESNLLFDYSAYNINALFALINYLNIYHEDLFLDFIKNVTIDGRCEVIKLNNKTIIITIAITILEALKRYKDSGEINNIILVSGSIGVGHNSWNDKYNSKEQEEYLHSVRKYAMEYACRYSDYIYLTSNDPASTNPNDICNEMEKYLQEQSYYHTHIEIDRYKAIKKAIDLSLEGDVIIISGRGSRNKYIKDNREYIFSDKDIINKIIKDKNNGK